jgi:hypothetical protein
MLLSSSTAEKYFVDAARLAGWLMWLQDICHNRLAMQFVDVIAVAGN